MLHDPGDGVNGPKETAQARAQALRNLICPAGLSSAPAGNAVRPAEGSGTEFYNLLWQLAQVHESAVSSSSTGLVPPQADAINGAKKTQEAVKKLVEADLPVDAAVSPKRTSDGDVPQPTETPPILPVEDPPLVPGSIPPSTQDGGVTSSTQLPPVIKADTTASFFSADDEPAKEPQTPDCNKSVTFRPSANSDRTDRNSKRRISRRVSLTAFKLRGAWAENQLFLAQRRVSMSRTKAFVPNAIVDEPVTGKSLLQRFVLHPSSQKRFAWDVMCMALLTYDIAVIPFVEAFQPTYGDFLVVMMWSTMFFWTVDMFVSGLTGFQERRTVVLEPRRTVQNYLHTWFALDIIIVALDWTLVLIDPTGGASAARLGRSLRTLRFARTLRLVRLIKLKRILQEIHDQIDTESFSILFGILKILITLCVANHVVACGWYAIGVQTHPVENWVTFFDMRDRSVTYRYTTALHWSLTQFTPASMEIVPQNVEERIYSVIVIIIAMMMFSTFLSILTTSMAELRNISNDAARQFWLLRRYFKDWGISKEVITRVTSFLEYAYEQQRQRVQEKDVTLLLLLSQPLREELKFEAVCFHLTAHPLFYSISESMRMFAKAVDRVYLARGDFWFSCGETARTMTILSAGLLAYLPGQDEESPKNGDLHLPEDVQEGQWVAEAAMWTDWLHLGDLTALVECQGISVSVEEFEKIAQHNRPMWLMFQRYASRFIEELNQIPKMELTDLLHTIIRPTELLEDDAAAAQRLRFKARRTQSFGGGAVSAIRSYLKGWKGGWWRRK